MHHPDIGRFIVLEGLGWNEGRTEEDACSIVCLWHPSEMLTTLNTSADFSRKLKNMYPHQVGFYSKFLTPNRSGNLSAFTNFMYPSTLTHIQS